MTWFRRKRDSAGSSVDPQVVAAVSASGLFDPAWYLATYPEIGAFPLGPLLHFCQHGMREHRDPGPNFSTRKYCESVPEAATAPLPPFLHALAHASLDRDWPLWQPDDMGALEALVAWSGLFDEPWYLRRHPDVARSGIPPLRHFVQHGASELRDPGPGFDSELYAETYAYDRAAYSSPIEHYLRVGRLSGHLATGPSRYERWIALYDALTPADVAHIQAEAGRMPPIAIVQILDAEAAASFVRIADALDVQIGPAPTVHVLRGASLPDDSWNACIAHGGARRFHADAVRLLADLAPGSVVLLCAGGAILRPHAVTVFAKALAAAGGVAAYADHDRIGPDGTRMQPVFKPAMSPDFIGNLAYAGPVVALVVDDASTGRIQAALADAATGAGAEAWAGLLLGLEPSRIVRVPFVLYHMPGPIPEPPLPTLEPIPETAVAERLAEPHGPLPSVRLVIPTRDRLVLLQACLASIEADTDYSRSLFEIVIVDNGSTEDDAIRFLRAVDARPGTRVVAAPGPFNFATICNAGAAGADADILVFLNNDITVRRRDWLARLVAYARRPEIGAVGARLLYPDGSVQHGGVVLGVDGVGAHRLVHVPETSAAQVDVTREISAVTGACLAIRREVFERLGGFDPLLAVAFNDVALCAAAIAAGYRNIYVAEALLDHHESQTRGSDETPAHRVRNHREAAYVRSRHGALIRDDPSYSPNLSLRRIGSLAHPPRVIRPWRRAPDGGRRVLFLGDVHEPGHAATTMLGLQAARLRERGWDVIVGGPACERDSPFPGCRRVVLTSAEAAAICATNQGVDCVVVHARAFVSVIRWLGAHPLVYIVDQGDESDAIDWEMRLCAPLARRVFATTPAARDRQFRRDAILLRSGNTDGPVWSDDWADRRPALRRTCGFDRRFVVLSQGRAGLERFAEIAAEAAFAHAPLRLDAIFVLVARLDPDALAEATAAGLLVFDDMAEARVADLYAASDLYLSLSRGSGDDPGFGRARAMGLDVVAAGSGAHARPPIETADGIPALCALLARRYAEREETFPRRAVLETWDEPLGTFTEYLEADCAQAARQGWS